MTSTRFHNLTIQAVRPQSGDATALRFAIPEDLKQTFSFIPGQYLTLMATIDGEEIRRSYSICSAHLDNFLEVGIRRVEGGRFSNHALSLKAGDTIPVMPPEGRFTAPLGGKHNYLLLAAGSGITPCLSIAKSVLESEEDSEITLVYGNRTAGSVMFLDDISDLKDRYTKRFSVIHMLSREQTEVPLFSGRLDGDHLHRLFERGVLDPELFDAAYICGPQPMIESVKDTLSHWELSPQNIKFELFGTFDTPPPAKARSEDAVDGAIVEIILDGLQKTIQMDASKQTVLAAAQQAGLDLPFSCAGGMCCTCRCKIVEGKAEMDLNYSLQDWEIEAGFTLACQSRPLTDNLVLDFDAS